MPVRTLPSSWWGVSRLVKFKPERDCPGSSGLVVVTQRMLVPVLVALLN